MTHVTVIMPDRRNEALKTAHEAISCYWNNAKPDNDDWSGHHDMGANALNEIEQCIGRPGYNRDKDQFINTDSPF